MNECDLASYDLLLREVEKKWEHGYEVRASLYCGSTGDLVAWFSTTTRTSDKQQILNTSNQFVLQHYLTIGQINAITQWLRERTMAARWRLTPYTVLVEARP